MEVIIPAEKNLHYETQAKADVLKALEPSVEKWMAQHLKKRRLWFPSDFLPADEQMDEDQERTLTKLRERARGLSDAIRVSIILNLITEEGLPHYHRLLSNYLGNESVWRKWNYMWTAEEDRHGVVLHDYTRDTRLFKMREVEMLQYAYQEAGFTPDWQKDPYQIFVYTSLQERATQFSHLGTGKVAGDEEPMLKGILQSIAADEARHFIFYRTVFKNILELDPNRGLQSALAIMPLMQMPGTTIPGFLEMADIVRRLGIYTPWDYKKIVEEAIKHWKIEVMTGLNDAGRKAQEKIMAIPRRLQRFAELFERRSTQKTFSFEFIYGRNVVMD